MHSRKVAQELGTGRWKEACQPEKATVGRKWQKELQEQKKCRGSTGNTSWVLEAGRKHS